MTLILGIGAAIAVVLAVLVLGALLVGSLIRKARKGKQAAPVASVAAPAAEPFRYPTPAEIERQELVARSVKRTAERFDAKHEAELDAKLDELNAPAAK